MICAAKLAPTMTKFEFGNAARLHRFLKALTRTPLALYPTVAASSHRPSPNGGVLARAGLFDRFAQNRTSAIRLGDKFAQTGDLHIWNLVRPPGRMPMRFSHLRRKQWCPTWSNFVLAKADFYGLASPWQEAGLRVSRNAPGGRKPRFAQFFD
jgi:hypothetical protein